MTTTTEAVIAKRLREAVSLREMVNRTGHAPKTHRGPSPDAPGQHAVEHCTQALSWLDWLQGEDAALVEARLEGARWKMICWRFGISRPTAHRRWRHALGLIAWRLNGHTVPAKCSRRRFMQLADRR